MTTGQQLSRCAVSEGVATTLGLIALFVWILAAAYVWAHGE